MHRIGRYEILEEIGRGAMGAVYRARDPEIGRTVAIKVILAGSAPGEDAARYRQRFRREAQTAGQLSHPAIVTIHDIAEDESGRPYLVMEFIEGQSLQAFLRPTPSGMEGQRLPLRQSLDIGAQLADALDYAHAHGVVHRDIKPGNILLTPQGRVKLADFGIAKFASAEDTQPGRIFGTFAYAAPEQVRGEPASARSDIFSLGAVLYWMCTGTKPFPGDAVTTVAFHVVCTVPKRPTEVDSALPRDLDIVLSRCLAKDPAHRYAAAGELARDLAAVRDGKSISTTAAPPEQTVEETLSASLDAVISMAAKRAPGRGWSARFSKPAGILAAIFVLAATVIFFWPRPTYDSKSSPSAQSPAGSSNAPLAQRPPGTTPAPPAISARAPSPASDSSAAVVAAAEGEASPRLMATLNIECVHNLKEGSLDIFSGEIRVYRATLAEGAKLTGRIGLRPGERALRVRVRSEAGKFDDEKEISAKFAQGESRTLLVEISRGLTLKRRVSLKWK